MADRRILFTILCCLPLCALMTAGDAVAGPPGNRVEGPHRTIPGFSNNSCGACHDIVAGSTGIDAVRRPNETCLGCHTDGAPYPGRPNATVAKNHDWMITGSTKFVFGDLGLNWSEPGYNQEIHCTTCHDPHRTYRPDLDPNPSTTNIKYIRDHTDDWVLNPAAPGGFELLPSKELKVFDDTGQSGPAGTEVIKTIDNDIVFTASSGPGSFADGFGQGAADTDICEACHTLTNHHQADNTAPGGQSHFDGEDCTSCHTHVDGFKPSGGAPLTGPHAAFGDPDCGACHDRPTFPGGPDNPTGLPSIFCQTCHGPAASATYSEIHSHLITGTGKFEYNVECTTCHDQHGWDVTNIEGTDNLKYIKAGFSTSLTVVDNTGQSGPVGTTINKSVSGQLIFTARTGPGSFADGDGVYTEDVCNTCHTLTNHHQNDGTAPGGQSHFDGEDCIACHDHAEGFKPQGQPLTGPHAGFGDPNCGACHDLATFPGGVDNPSGDTNILCATCHGDLPTGIDATDAHIHASSVTSSTDFDYAIKCVSCHDQHGWDLLNVNGVDNVKYVKPRIDESLTVTPNGGAPIVKAIDNDIVYTSTADFADGIGNGAADTDICESCHTLTNHHRRDASLPPAQQSHFDGQDCTTCHTHVSGFAPSGGGVALDGPHSAVTGGDCGVCHDQVAGGFEGALDNSDLICMSCHGAAPTVVDAIDAHTHSDGVTGTMKFGYTNNCTYCHQPHQQNIQPGGNYIRAVIEDLAWNSTTSSADPVPIDLTVIDKTGQSGPVPTTITKSIQTPITYAGPASLGDGGGGSLCETCHSLTDHHQNDGTAPGGQSHFDGQDCTQCHLHVEGFGPDGASFGLEGPHAAMPIGGVPANDCGVCHNQVLGGVAGALANPDQICMSCHGDAPTLFDATDAHTHSTAVTGSSRFDYANNCTNCHNPHKQSQPGGKYIRGTIEDLMLDPVLGAVSVPLELTVTDNTGQSSPATFTKSILSDIFYDGSTTLADGGGDDICESCHTVTNHHQNDGTAPGGQSHFDGTDCTGCHKHVEGFTPTGIENHPQAQSDCSNCHVNRGTGEPDLLGQHDNNCELCHVSGFDSTLLGPLGTFTGECSECHNPNVNETGNMDVPTKRHRCVVCHGEQLGSGGFNYIHEKHAEETNCVTCHGFIPDVGTQIGSGNRDICVLCHGSPRSDTDIEKIHDEHIWNNAGLSCLECHGGERPPVDVFFGAPVGGADVVCEICHEYRDEDPDKVHRKHVGEGMDCGFCHMDANLQDDRVPMPPIDDVRRAMVDRAGENECGFCHSPKSRDVEDVHHTHHGKQQQWCYNCHEGDDPRPTGDAPPVTEPAQACALCHTNESYNDSFPFDIHEEHAGKDKCYACHQAVPRIFDWPNEWLGGTDPSPGDPGGGDPPGEDAVTVRDEFNSVSFSNNDGPDDWSGPWLEDDPQSGGSGPNDGQVRVRDGKLRLDDYRDTGGEPSAARAVDLAGLTNATFSFDWSTSSGVDSSDRVEVEVSSGGSYTTLKTVTGFSGSRSGSESYDISAWISAQTTIRFRVTRYYGGSDEYFYADNVEITAD